MDPARYPIREGVFCNILMFTGIIQSTASILEADSRNGCLYVRLTRPKGWKLRHGQSITVDGICTTVVKHQTRTFDVVYMPETLAKTTAKFFTKKHVVNLEHSLKFGDLIDGHLVQGHVDAVGVVTNVATAGGSRMLFVRLPQEFMKYVARKGSIAVNGVSLTVAQRRGDTFSVALIPYTLKHTNLGNLQKGSRVNVEVDVFSRYIAALLNKPL